jgi:transcription initiation factor IIF auxiliary subunit
MNLKLRNRWKYKGDNWWEWEAFIDDENSGDLNQVKYVEYVLHNTFPNPVRLIDDPQGGFVLRTAGWGFFELKAFVYTQNNEKIKLSHWIELEVEPQNGVSN